jgi:16S rRNA (cytosine967-C5)-methyltransferase
MSSIKDARQAAVRILVDVYAAGRSLTQACSAVLPQIPEARDRALAQDLAYGVLRWNPRLEALLALLLQRPLGRRDLDVHCLALVGLYQLIHTRVPPHAAVAATVAVTAALGKSWARGLINAVLRRFQREAAELLAQIDARPEIALAHPEWLFERMRADWPDDAEAIAAVANEHPPMVLRINRLRIGRDDYLDRLREAGLEAEALAYCHAGILLERPQDVARLPGFAEGLVSVQDGAAQLAAPLLELKPGQRVLDLCAAPGGKTAHILETEPEIAHLVAVDIDAARLQRVREGLDRLGVRAELVCGDGARPQEWWDGAPFDRILLDAPCSGTGVIRRHPDIKRLRRPEDIVDLAARQRELLDAAWTMLTPGGMLLYVTCSIIQQENDIQLAEFVSRHDDARVRSISAPWGRAQSCGRQILPVSGGMDGFFYGRVDKLATGECQP